MFSMMVVREVEFRFGFLLGNPGPKRLRLNRVLFGCMATILAFNAFTDSAFRGFRDWG